MKSHSFPYNPSRDKQHVQKFSAVPCSLWTARPSGIQVPRLGRRSRSVLHWSPRHKRSLLWKARAQCRWLQGTRYSELLLFQSLLWISSVTPSRRARRTPKREEAQHQYPCATAKRHFKNFAGSALKLDQDIPELHFRDRDQKCYEFFQVLNVRRHLRP